MADGRLELLLGETGGGKSSLTANEIGRRQHVICAPGPTNQTMEKYNYLYDSDDDLVRARDLYEIGESFAIYYKHDNPRIFDFMGRVQLLWVDEISYFKKDKKMLNRLDWWSRNIRSRHQVVMANTHRAGGDVPDVLYSNSRLLRWVGPCSLSPQQLSILYGVKSVNCMPGVEFEEFRARIQALKPYKWDDPNVEESVLVIKDMT